MNPLKRSSLSWGILSGIIFDLSSLFGDGRMLSYFLIMSIMQSCSGSVDFGTGPMDENNTRSQLGCFLFLVILIAIFSSGKKRR